MYSFHSSSNASTLNTIKDMIAGLPQFQEGKDLYSLHLGMAQECMNIFQNCKLPEVASVEQVRPFHSVIYLALTTTVNGYRS